MPLQIVRNDITRMNTDAIVNTANPRPIIGAGTDSAIHTAAGPRLLEAREVIGNIPRGEARLTPGFDLPAKYVIHAVGCRWDAESADCCRNILRSCYDSALLLALEQGCKSISFPLMAAGCYGFPEELALNIANEAFTDFLAAHELDIYLVLFDPAPLRYVEQLRRDVPQLIDDAAFRSAVQKEYPQGLSYERSVLRNAPSGDMLFNMVPRAFRSEAPRRDTPSAAPDAEEAANPKAAPKGRASRRKIAVKSPDASRMAALAAESGSAAPLPPLTLEEALQQKDESFAEMLFRKIDELGIKDSECYSRANLSKAAFSKIRKAYACHELYTPKRSTAYAFALALRLDLTETRELLGKAGYAMTNSIPLDAAMAYFISRRIYNISLVNIALFENDLPQLGG